MGLPVIAATISATLRLQYRKRADATVVFESKNTGERQAFSLDEVGDFTCDLKYWHAVLARLRPHVTTGFEAVLDSAIPIGAGLSSSAAITVALVRALDDLFALHLTTDQVAETAYLAEHADLGIMCGRLDQYSIAHGGVTFIETGDSPRVTPLQVPPVPMVVGDTQEPRHAQQILNRVKQDILAKDPTTLDAFEKMHQCVLGGREALERGDFKRVGELMSAQQVQEGRIAADTPKLNALCEGAVEGGAFGAKQMGAGGGGCMVAVCPPGVQARVAAAIEAAGGKAWVFDLFTY